MNKTQNFLEEYQITLSTKGINKVREQMIVKLSISIWCPKHIMQDVWAKDRKRIREKNDVIEREIQFLFIQLQ